MPPPTSTARRAKLQHEVFPSTDAGDAHAGPSEDAAAQHEGAAGERAPRRSGRHRTPSRRLADAVAYAAGRQHGALIAPKRAADGQPPSADEGRPKKSRRLTAQLHLRGVPQQPCCQYITCLQIAAVRTWTQACMSKGRVSLQPDSRTLSCADHWDAGKPPRTSPLQLAHVCRSRRRQSRRTTSASPAGTACSPVADRPARATPLPSAALWPPQPAELLVGNPVSPAQMDGLPLTVGDSRA